MSVCKSCGAPIIWAVSPGGKFMPVDGEPVEAGTILLSHQQVGEPPVARVQLVDDLERLRAEHERSPQAGPLRLFTSHLATCPNVATHRRPRQPSKARPSSAR